MTKALEALKEGIVDGVGALDEALAFIQDANLTTRADKGVYGLLKAEMWKESLALLENSGASGGMGGDKTAAQKKEDSDRERRVRDWELRAKL